MSDLIPVLIVEDDHIILDDLLTLINWEAEGFLVVATAINGKLGWDAYCKHHPQLIITDIQMPVMGGLAMMRQLRQEDGAVSFLILSAYGEFEYAKEAVRLGTDSYLLKTELSPKLLRETLASIREKITSRQAMHKLTTRHQLFALISASIEPKDQSLAPPQEVSKALSAYLRINTDREDCRTQLQNIVRECYSILGIYERYTPCPSAEPEAMEAWLMHEYDRLCDLNEYLYVKAYSPVIINAWEYIRSNYGSSQLQISEVAEHVGLSSSRLSVLFKLEVGKTVNEYITEVRINEAKRLLRTGRHKVYEVSELVGYKTSQYFSQVFYQNTGEYPTAYLRGTSL